MMILRARYWPLVLVARKVAVVAFDYFHALILMHIELVVFGYAAIVFERFGAVGFLVHRRHRYVADLEQLRRGEEDHVRRVVIERVG